METRTMLQKPKVLSGYKDIANFLGVSTKTIQRNLKYIPVSRLGTKVMILESDLVKWIRENVEEIKIKKLKEHYKCK